MKTTNTLLFAFFGIAAAASCTSKDPNAVCGDGNVDTDEQCDDGNLASGDGCSGSCLIEIPENCGDGVVDGEEECDSGGESASCDIDCTEALCGDGIRNVTKGEACDDGNTIDGDMCSSDCRLEVPGFCGDGNVNDGEMCDDGMETESCDDDCTEVICGDGKTNAAAGEACDDGNTEDGDACSASCQIEEETCGLPGLSCGTTVMGTTTDANATDIHDSYPCLAGEDKSGPEHIYEWVADRTGQVSVFSEFGKTIDVIVTEATGTCDLGTCLAAGESGALFDATEGTRYHIIVDSDPGAAVSFFVGMNCL